MPEAEPKKNHFTSYMTFINRQGYPEFWQVSKMVQKEAFSKN